MITTVFYDITASFIMGLVVALSARRQIAKEKTTVANPYFASTVLFGIFVLVPIGIYFFFVNPHWALMYFIDMENPLLLIGVWVSKTFIGCLSMEGYALALIISYLIAQALIKRDNVKGVLWILGIAVVFFLILVGLTFKRILYVGTTAQWCQGNLAMMTPLWEHKLGLALIPGVGICAVAVGYILVRFVREGKAMG